MKTSGIQHKPGRNVNHVFNAWHIGWCWVVADSPITPAVAKAAKKSIGAYIGEAGAQTKAWPYLVNDVECDVICEHAASLASAAEKGKKMADTLRSFGITSRVYVMTDKQYGMGYCPNMMGDSTRAAKCNVLKGIAMESDEKHPLLRLRWVLTQKQSIPVYQTSL